MKGYYAFAFQILLFCLGVFNLQGQSLRGFYTGQLKLVANGAKLGAQVDLMEDSGRYTAVFRSRVVDGLTVSGCDNWLEGILKDGKLEMNNILTLRETNVPSGVCNYFRSAKLVVKQENGNFQIAGNLINQMGDVYGRLSISRVDTAISFSVEEEKMEAKRKIGEVHIAQGLTDNEIIERMISIRGMNRVDTVSFVPVNASLKIEAPDADLYHKLTVVVNEDPVLIAASPRQQGAVLRLKDMVPGDMEVVFLCYHLLVDVMYDIKVTLTWDGGEKVWTLPVSTYSNTGLVLRILEPGK